MGAPLLRLLRLAGVVARTTGQRALYAALPLYFLVGIASTILFGGQGMDAKTLTIPALASFPLRLGLLVGWALSTLPVARRVVADARVDLLRALPVPRSWLLGLNGAMLGIVQLGWAVLWVRGSGWLAGAEALVAVLALQCSVILGAHVRILEGVGLAAVAAGWWLAPSAASLAVLAPAFVLTHHAAWRRAPEANSAGRHHVLGGSAPLALASALAVAAWRDNASAAARAAAMLLFAGLATRLGLRNAAWGFDSLLRWAAALWGAACLLGAVTLARPVLRAEAELGWVLDVCAASSRLRAGVSLALALLVFGGTGCVFSLSLFPALHGAHEMIALTLQLGLGGAAWASLAVASVRAGTRGGGEDSRRQLAWLLALYLPLTLLLIYHPSLMLLILIGVAALASRHAARLPTPASAARGP
jgi:hypothetical protein